MNKKLRQKIDEIQKDYEKRAAILERYLGPHRNDIVLQSTKDGIYTLQHNPIVLSKTDCYILINCLTPKSLLAVHNELISKELPVGPTDIYCKIVASLIARNYLSYQTIQDTPQKDRQYTGTLTVSADGNISFTPDNEFYREAFGSTPLLTVQSNLSNIQPYRPIIVVGKGDYIRDR